MEEKLNIKIRNCEFILCGRRDQQGHQYFTLKTDDFEVKLTSFETALDLLNNNSFGFITLHNE